MVLRYALLALAISLGRTLLDWGFVFPEFGFKDPASVLGAMVFYVVIFTAWILALLSIARGGRAGLWVALALTLLLNVGLGLGTTVAFCPTPCRTLWPVGELWNWATTLSGIAASVLIIRSLRARPAGPS
jgi:hypothetical protein